MIADVVERRIPIPGGFSKTKDLFNIFDIVALTGNQDRCDWLGHNLLLVQTTSVSNRASRRKKMLAEIDTMFALNSIRSVVPMLICWGKKGRSYECTVEITRPEYVGGGKAGDRITFTRIAMPTMQTVRANVRAYKKPERRERVSRSGVAENPRSKSNSPAKRG